MSNEKYLTYRGELKSAVAVQGTLVFVTAHTEDQPTAVYRLDVEKLTLSEDALPQGGHLIATDADSLWIAGSDRVIYQCPAKGGKPVARGEAFAEPIEGLVPLANERLAVLTGKQIVVRARKDGKTLQTLELPDVGTVLAVDPTGQWLIAGTSDGTVAVFDGEGKDEFVPSEASKLHEGPVTALLFEQEELRFYSAGADQKLLSTHARGKLEPEDRGRGNSHTIIVTALIWVPGDRFCSGSIDRTVKSWPRVGAARPVTLKDGVGEVIGLALVPIHNRPHLAVLCADNTIRLFLIDPAGKFGDLAHKIHGAVAWAKNELAQDDARRREAALKELAAWNDTASIEMLAEQVARDPDHGLRLLAAQLLGSSANPRAAKLLEKSLGHNDEAVRVSAFQGLRKHRGDADLGPLDLALQVEKPDVGKLAVQALESLAKKDDQALTRLIGALNAKTLETRQAALASLEKVYDAQSPEANLIALNSPHADLRRLTLIRLLQRQMLHHASVQTALRRRTEDADASVRLTAFLLAILTRDKLQQALRARNPDFHRLLHELETFSQEPAAQEKKAKPPAPKEAKLKLEESDWDPLLQATASRALDTCLRGAMGLALLNDPRAFGLLLQLSRDANAQARVSVCQALAALGDPRSVKRLRSLLYDPEAAVRDAAFTALASIYESEPLQAAESGLNASFEDVKKRGLQVLVSLIRKAPPKNVDEPTWQFLVRALNDGIEGVRSEAFKAALNLKVAGGGVQTLRFVLQSVHADVRREVLTEAMAQVGESWAWNLLLEFYNDHDPELRKEAFAFAVKKNKELAPLESGLASQYVDIRKTAVEALVKKQSKAAAALLVRALADPEEAVRSLALEALIDSDAQPALAEALLSQHADIRVRAACALARHGNREVLAPLLAVATAQQPKEKERLGEWSNLVRLALEGLGELGDPAALPHVIGLLSTEASRTRAAAANALMWTSRPGSLEALRQALQHSDPQVKYHAALGLAYCGDPLVASLVFSEQAVAVYANPTSRIAAAINLGPTGEDRLAILLDDANETLRNQALVALLLLELKSNQGTPTRCLACLASLLPRVRLAAARALEAFADPDAFLQVVVDLFNDKGEEQPWKVPAATIETLAELLAHASPQTRARSALLLSYLTQKEQATWNHAWAMHEERFKAEIAAIKKSAPRRTASQHTAAQLQQLAFGAYVGLMREGGGASGTAIIRVRQTALNRIRALAAKDAHHARAAQPIFVQALGDPNQAVRLESFDHLQAIGLDPTALGAESLETGHLDLGVKGLQLLTGGASAAQGQAVLEKAMLSRKDGLALEAAKLQIPHRGVAVVAGKALEAVHEPLRIQAIHWLAEEYDKDAAAKKQLQLALESRYQKVRETAALALATKKDPVAFAALVKLLASAPDAGTQKQVIFALTTLGDRRAPTVLLDRLQNDPSGTALTDDILQAVGSFRQVDVVDRLLANVNHPKWAKALQTVYVISGFDQVIEDPEDEAPDRRWKEKQFPHHVGILARLIERALQVGNVKLVKEAMPDARWARGPEVDPILSLLCTHADAELRQQVVEAVGWRLRKRISSADPLVKALQHKDSITQFLAAEGLAKGGRAEGLNVLLAAVDYLTDIPLRQRAVLALGELADPRALDLLLKLASEDGHALQEQAAEAIGHLGRTEKGEEIFQLLERFAKGGGGVAVRALKGLRWLNTPTGWQLIRRQAVDASFSWRATAVELLGYNDEPATRELLVKLLINEEDDEVVRLAFASAQRLWGKDSLEPHYAWLQNPQAEEREDGDSLERVGKQGEPRRLFEIIPRCAAEIQQPLAISLLNRPTLPLAEAQEAIGGEEERAVQVAAQIIGRAGSKATKSGQAIETALKKWLGIWNERRLKMVRTNAADERLTDQVTPCIQVLLWAAGRLGVAADVLLAAVTASPDDRYYRPIRQSAVAALVAGKLTDAAVSVLEAVAQGNDAESRTLAVEALARHNAKRAAALAPLILADRVSFNRLTAHKNINLDDTLRTAAGQLHYQGLALPSLIAKDDLAALTKVAEDRKLPEATRLGAIEALAMLAQEPAEAKLAQIGKTAQEDEDLRKAAWRALRRSKRARQRKHIAETKA